MMIGKQRKTARNARVTRGKEQFGVGMVEVMVAILLVSFGILGLLKMQAFSVGAMGDSKYRAEAVALADLIVSRIWVETGTDNILPAYVNDNAALPDDWLALVNNLPGAVDNPPTMSSTASNVITLIIRWQPPSGRVSNYQVVTTVRKNTF